MEQVDLMDEFEEHGLLRQYLLGALDDDTVRDRLEERLMVDEDFAVRVGVAEDELIEEFLDGEMSAEESALFSRFFLAPPERKRQLRLTRDLRRISGSPEFVSPHRERGHADRAHTFGWMRFAAIAGVLVAVGVGAWMVLSNRSDTARGLDQLRAAYRDRRPTESRLSGLPGYAPYPVTRGSESVATDSASLDRAQRYLTDATANSQDADAHDALAVYYLVAGDLDRAEREMAAALRSGADNAKIRNDAGALYLEIAKDAAARGDGAKALTSLNLSMEHLDRALELDSTLLEARFNRALALQALMLPEQAKTAWREYLDRDSNSKWADEARQDLQKLEAAGPKDLSADELESDFLAAFRAGDEARAADLIADNRELIRDKYLPHHLAMAYLGAPEERRDELREAMQFAGKLEMKTTGDPFAKTIADFYAVLPESKRAPLWAAHQDIRRASKLSLKGDFKNAFPLYESAEAGFASAGDVTGAALAGYFVAYALVNLDRAPDALVRLERVRSWTAENRYSWLEGAVLHWIAQSQRKSKQITNAEKSFNAALAVAKKIGDGYAEQRNLLALARLHADTGQSADALNDLFSVLRSSIEKPTIFRQRYRNIFQTFPILMSFGMSAAARPFTYEAVALADQLNDPMWVAQSRSFAGVAAVRLGDVDEARRLLIQSETKAASIKADETRAMVVAFSDLNSAEFERSMGNFEAAEQKYLAAALFYDDASKEPILREQVRNGLLRTYVALGRSAEVERRIPDDIQLAEEYRRRISDEVQNIGFFALRESVYDTAAEFEVDRGNAEAAYNYAEISSSRSLLERLRKGSVGDAPIAGEHPERPLDLADIQRQLPLGVQVLQFSVFENKIVIWLVNRDGFAAVPVKIDARQLGERVAEFSTLTASPASADNGRMTEFGRELYDLLIAPVRDRLDPEMELCIIPSKFLFDVPFAALIAPDSKPLVAAFRLLQAPSANVFVAATRNAATRGGSGRETILAVGDPAFDRDSFPNLPRLQAAQAEAADIARLYSEPRTFVRDDATKAAFLDALPKTDVVHFAGHYVTVPGAPMSSFLLFAREGESAASELSNSELTGLDLPRTRLIVLAACRSGVETYYDGEGMVGMSRTMLAAKVPLVVAAAWNVDSAATAEFMKRFHTFRAEQKLPTTAALRAAQLEMLNDPSGNYRSPYYWAAFAVYGGHASF